MIRCLSGVVALAIAVLVAIGISRSADNPPAQPAASGAGTAFDGGRAAILRTLDEPIEVPSGTNTVAVLAARLRESLGVSVVIDERSLQDGGVSLTAPLGESLPKLTLRAALRHLLGPLELRAVVFRSSLLITTPEKADAALEVRVYNVRDLIAIPTSAPESEWDEESLVELITTTIAPQSWGDNGGPASIKVVHGLLPIRQTADIHDEIANLLSALRAGARNPEETTPIAADRPSQQRAREQIEQALLQRVTCKFDHLPVSGLVARLHSLGIPALLETPPHAYPSASPEKPQDADEQKPATVSLQVTQLPLVEALRLALGPLDLEFSISEEVLSIGTSEQVDARLRTVVYPVTDLVESTENHDPLAEAPPQDFESLIDVITTVVRPPTWDESGGPGSIKEFDPGMLCIRQTDDAHADIVTLLQDMRRLRASVARPVRKPVDENRVITRIYPLRDETVVPSGGSGGGKPSAEEVKAELAKQENRLRAHEQRDAAAREVAAAVRQFVEPASWNDGTAQIQAVGGQLIVRHKIAVHRKIDTFLRSIGSVPTGGLGGSGPAKTIGSGFF